VNRKRAQSGHTGGCWGEGEKWRKAGKPCPASLVLSPYQEKP
jgi:hypothetical protein